MKNIWKSLLYFCFTLAAVMFLSGNVTAYAYTGSGELYDPYCVSSYSELKTLLWEDTTSYIRLNGEVKSVDSTDSYALDVRGRKILDMNGYDIRRDTTSMDRYLIQIESGATFFIQNSDDEEESYVICDNHRPTDKVVLTSLIECDAGGTFVLGSPKGDPITLDYSNTRENIGSTMYTVCIYGDFTCYDGVTIGGYDMSLTAYDPNATLTVFGGTFQNPIRVYEAKSCCFYQAVIEGANSADRYPFRLPLDSLAPGSHVCRDNYSCGFLMGVDEFDHLIMYVKPPKNLEDTVIVYKNPPVIMSYPSSAEVTADGSQSLSFDVTALYMEYCRWSVGEYDAQTSALNVVPWSDVKEHCIYNSISWPKLEITPKRGDTWLNNKVVFCEVYNRYGQSKTITANMTVNPYEAPLVGKNPKNLSGYVNEDLYFSIETEGVSRYQWQICDSADDLQPYDWSYITSHVYCAISTEREITIRPLDTWLNGKAIYCELYDANGVYLGCTDAGEIRVFPAIAQEKITFVSISGLEEPVVGNYPDTTLGVGGNSEAGIQYTVTWYRNESGLLKPISNDQPFEADVRYYARATLYPMDDAAFAYYEETDDYEETYQVYDGTVTINGEYYDGKCYLNYGNLNVTLWNQEAAAAYRILSNPSSATCDVNEDMSFEIEAEGVSGYQWQICDSEDDTQPYSWSTVLKHASCISASESSITIRPLDTWLDGKAIYCEVYNAKGRYMGESDTASIRVYPAENLQQITSVEITELEDPVIGNEPDTTIAVDDNCHAGMQYTVAWYRNDSGRLTPISDGELFESGVKYLATITLYPVDGTAFAYYEETDDNEDTNQVYDGTVTINDEAFGSKCYLINGKLRISWWNQEAMEVIAPHIHKYETVITKATLTQNGKIETKCSCGDVSTTKTIYRPENFKLSAYNYVYDGSVKTPTLTIKDTNGKTIAASNYTLTKASGRKNVGMYIYTVKFKGNYSGTNKINFQIIPKATSLTTLTAKSKAFTVGWKKQTTQTTGYLLQYATKSNFANQVSVKITKNTTVSKPISKLKAKKKYYVRIQTYKVVNGKYFYSKWSKVKYITTKA